MRRPILAVLLLAAACGDEGDPLVCPDAGFYPPTSTTLVVLATDGPGGPPLPARVVLYDSAGMPLRIGRLDMFDGSAQDKGYCDLAPGVIGTWDGIALADGSGDIPVGDDFCMPAPAVPFDTYKVHVMRGIDYEIFETQVTLLPKQGRVVVEAPLRRAWTPQPGALAADLHVHADPSGDSNVPEEVRVITEAVTGIQVIGASDHNFNGNYDAAIEAAGLRGRIASLSGNEVTVDLLHANVFPALVEAGKPDGGAKRYEELRGYSAAQLFGHMRSLQNRPLVQLNHPRLRFAAYFDAVGWNGVSWPLNVPVDFDAIETLTGWYSYNAPTDPRLDGAMRDFYTFIEHGQLVTATGNSDTHHLNSILAGVPRNYVSVPGAGLDPLDPLDEDGFVDAMRARRVMVTTCPYLEVHAGNGLGPGDLVSPTAGRVSLSIRVRQATFCKAERVRIWMDGGLRDTLTIPVGETDWSWSGDVTAGAKDTWLGVDVYGGQGMPIEINGDSHFTVGGMAPAAIINPILVDADGDGRWTVAQKPAPPPRDVPPPPGSPYGPADCSPPGGIP